MKSKKVISNKNLPSRSPIMATVVYATALHYWGAPEWLWGATGFIMLMVWMGWIINICIQDSIDIMEKDQNVIIKSSFRERLEEALEKKGEK